MQKNNNKSSSQTKVDESNNKRKRSSERVISSLTDDLWIEIFLCLPLKSLLRFKSVSKSWFSIISSNRFAKSHLDRAIRNGEDYETLIVKYNLFDYDDDDDDEQEDGPYSLSHLSSGDILEDLEFPYSPTEYPSEPISSTIIGSDCGIVCVCVYLYSLHDGNNSPDIYLWNPATKLSKLIPPHSVLQGAAIGFGFDHIDLDFKVVQVARRTFSAEVYSSNKNTCQKIEPKPLDVPLTLKFDICLHGFLLTVGHKGMIAFDLNKEVFICNIELPVRSVQVALLVDFNDAIAACFVVDLGNKLNLWTLDEACLGGGGVEASWTLMLSIDVCMPFGSVVKGLFNSVVFSLIDLECEWFFYNPNNEVLCGPFRYFDIFKYSKSLFSIVGSKPVKWTASSSRLQDKSDSDVEMDEKSVSHC